MAPSVRGDRRLEGAHPPSLHLCWAMGSVTVHSLLCCGLVRTGKDMDRRRPEAAFVSPARGSSLSMVPAPVPGCGSYKNKLPPRGVVCRINNFRYEQPVSNTLFIVQKQNTLSTNPHMQEATHPMKNTFISCKTQKCPLREVRGTAF